MAPEAQVCLTTSLPLRTARDPGLLVALAALPPGTPLLGRMAVAATLAAGVADLLRPTP